MPSQPRKTNVAINKMLDEMGCYNNGKLPSAKTLKRINAVKYAYQDLLSGGTFTSVCKKLENEEYGEGIKYTHREAEKVFGEAKKLIRIDFEMERPYLKEQLYAYLADIYKDCRENGDRYNAIQAINSIARILGLSDNKQQVQIQTDSGVTIKFGFGNDEDENKDEIDIQDVEIVE